MITVEIVYATLENEHMQTLSLPRVMTIEEVIHASQLLSLFSEIDLTRQKVGIYGKIKPLTHEVVDGDRIEIYRPLRLDPKEARRLRAKKKLRI